MRNPDTLKAAHDRRREAQRAKKRGDLAPEEETPGTGSARPAEPENPPSGKGKRPAEPADPPSGKGKGKRPAEPADPPKGIGKWFYGPWKGEFQKGKKGDYEKGKSKKGSSKGSTEKGKSKGYTARARARSEAARVRECFSLRRNPHYASFLSSFFTTPKECINL